MGICLSVEWVFTDSTQEEDYWLIVLSLSFSRTQSSKRHCRKQSDEEFEHTSEEEECLQISQKREKRGLSKELLKKKEGVEHVSSLILGRTGG
jgi:hypothetical protein